MVGDRNRCAVDLADFAKDFGLEGSIGKKLILVSEARCWTWDSSAIVEENQTHHGQRLNQRQSEEQADLVDSIGYKNPGRVEPLAAADRPQRRAVRSARAATIHAPRSTARRPTSRSPRN